VPIMKLPSVCHYLASTLFPFTSPFNKFLLKLVTFTFKDSTLFFNNLFTGGESAKSV